MCEILCHFAIVALIQVTYSLSDEKGLRNLTCTLVFRLRTGSKHEKLNKQTRDPLQTQHTVS